MQSSREKEVEREVRLHPPTCWATWVNIMIVGIDGHDGDVVIMRMMFEETNCYDSSNR